MEKVLAVAKVAMYVSLAVCFLFLSRLFWLTPDIVKQEMTATRQLLDSRADSLEQKISGQLTDWRATT